jgi:hypothetical protein
MFSDLTNVTDFLFLSKRILLYSLHYFKLLLEIKGEPTSKHKLSGWAITFEITTASHHLVLLIFSTKGLATRSVMLFPVLMLF